MARLAEIRTRFAVLTLAGVAGASAAAPAFADSGTVHYANCPAAPFNAEIGGYQLEYCFSDVVTPSGNANARFEGTLVDVAAVPAKAVRVEGFDCIAGYPSFEHFTTDTRMVVTPTGSVNGTCKFH